MLELLRTFSNGQDLFGYRARPELRRELTVPFLGGGWPTTGAPVADVVESAETIKVLVDLPGVDPASVGIQFENDVLSIQAERGLRD